MTALSIMVPFPVFMDRDGQPLDNGYVWIGAPYLNPQTNPVAVYFDEALTIPAPQPLRTINGYVSNSGTPAKLYVNGVNFSILVQDSKGTLVYSFPDGSGISPDALGVSYSPPFTGGVTTTVQAKLSEATSVKDFGAVGDGVTDDTAAFQAAVAAVDNVLVPSGDYVISSVPITKSVTFTCRNGAVFKRKAGLDIRQSYWNTGTAMFEVSADGLNIQFLGSPVFDGNKQNQPVTSINPAMSGATTEPAGWAFKYSPASVSTSLNAYFTFENALFQNGTTGYLLVRGPNNTGTGRVYLYLNDSRMTDTVYGYGKGDPATPTALGWSSDYIQILDSVELVATNWQAVWSQTPTPLGQYAPVACRATFFGTNFATSGQPTVALHGKTLLYGLGRKRDKYDDATDFVTNNGIGAVDVYGNGDSLYCNQLYAEKCENIPLRAKGSIKRFVALSSRLVECRGGLQVSPSSTGLVESNVYVGSVEAYNCATPTLEFVGTSISDTIKSVTVGNARLFGGVNMFNLAAASTGGIYTRNCDTVTLQSADVVNYAERGINVLDCQSTTILAANVKTVTAEGILCSGTNKNFTILSGYIDITGASGVSVQGATENVLISGVRTSNTVNYGIFVNSAGANNTIQNCSATAVAGINRGFYFAGDGYITGCYTNATTPLATGGALRVGQANNSWLQTQIYGIAAPTTGTWNAGDIVWDITPSATGFIGWVCVTAGTPGTWKTFGSISA